MLPLLGDAVLHCISDAVLYKQNAPLIEPGLDAVKQAYVSLSNPCPPKWRWYADWWDFINLRHQAPADVEIDPATASRTRHVLESLDASVVTRPAILSAIAALVDAGYLCGGRLTQEGLTAALAIRPRVVEENVTQLWVRRVVTMDVLNEIVRKLGPRCPRSVQLGAVSDHVQAYLTKAISRNSFRNQFAQGRPPTIANIVQWSFHAAMSEWRDGGRDAQTRSFTGALTEKDLKVGGNADIADRSMPADHQVGIFLSEDAEGGDSIMASRSGNGMPLLDVCAGDLEAEIIHRIAFQEGMQRVSAFIGEKSASEYLIDLDDAMIGRRGPQPSNPAVEKLREVSRRDSLAFQILKYLQENPFSLIADMEAPVNDEPSASCGGLGCPIPSDIVEALVYDGRIIQTRGGGYRLTRKGETVVQYQGHYHCVPQGDQPSA